MARCTPFHIAGAFAIAFFCIGVAFPFLSLTVWQNQFIDADNYEFYLAKNKPSMIWYDCITTLTPLSLPYPSASTTYFLENEPPISGSPKGFKFPAYMTSTKYVSQSLSQSLSQPISQSASQTLGIR
jgi:hypothetical protein